MLKYCTHKMRAFSKALKIQEKGWEKVEPAAVPLPPARPRTVGKKKDLNFILFFLVLILSFIDFGSCLVI